MSNNPSNTSAESSPASFGFPGAQQSGSESLSSRADFKTIVVSTVAGLFGAGINVALTDVAIVPWVIAGGIFGAIVGSLTPRSIATPGQGLIYGLGLGVLAWVIALVFLSTQRNSVMMGLPTSFPLFVRITVGFGTPVGCAVGASRSEHWPDDNLLKSVIGGSIAGISASVLFGLSVGPAGIIQSLRTVAMVPTPFGASIVHFLIAGVIGVSFGILFDREARGLGSALTYGLGYGLFWWLLGNLTLLPLVRSGTVAWSTELALARLANLIGHAVYGILLGLFYATLNGVWQGLFHNPDPVHPGTGAISIQSVGASTRGAVASVAGGLCFGVVLQVTGRLSVVASLVGRSDPVAGFLLHMGIAAIIGATYGQLFKYEAPDLGSGIIWGTIYGVVWWTLGPLTLLPLLLGNPISWSPGAIEAALPMLIGHTIYGVLTGATFTLLERRQAAWAAVDPQTEKRERLRRRPFGTVAPSLWLFILATMVIIPSTLL